jgi:hypothetical protein
LAAQNGERVRLFINEVGFVPGRVVRQTERFLAVAFEATDSVEHDLLIRKLFTSGFQTTNVKVSTGLRRLLCSEVSGRRAWSFRQSS